MSSGKKGKKVKHTTYNLPDFLASNIGGGPSVPVKTSWADDEEDEHDSIYTPRYNKEPVILPTAPRAARDPAYDEENVPVNGPYIAYMSNLPYEIEDDDLFDFFRALKISNIQIPKSADKPRSFGYVEFEDRQSLIDALAMTNQTIKCRPIKIEVSRSSNDDRRNRMGRDGRRDYYDDPERTSGDWRSGPRDEAPYDGDRYRNRGGYDRDNRDGGSESRSGGTWRVGGGGGGGGFDRERDSDSRSGWRDDRSRRERTGSRDRDGDRGGYGNRQYGRDYDRDRDQRNPAPESNEPRTRPKLQLAPRTKPIEQPPPVPQETSNTREVEARPPPRPSVPAANIFGAAKPVDTAAKEREIEERLARNAEVRSKDESEPRGDKGTNKEGTWGRRNGEGRDERDRERSRPAWRADEEKTDKYVPPRSQPRNPPRDGPGESRGYSETRGPPAPAAPFRGPPKPDGRLPPERTDREKKERHRDDDDDDELNRMPKAKEDQAPNFIASNKYSMLPDEDDSEGNDD